MPVEMMQVGGQSPYIVNQMVRFAYHFLWKWFVSLTLPVLLAGYVLMERDWDIGDEVVIGLILFIAIKNWYDVEDLRNRVETLEDEVEDHHFDYHHTKRDLDA